LPTTAQFKYILLNNNRLIAHNLLQRIQKSFDFIECGVMPQPDSDQATLLLHPKPFDHLHRGLCAQAPGIVPGYFLHPSFVDLSFFA
jgi:hypothetical protein